MAKYETEMITDVQVRFPFDTAARVCPPRMQFRIINPHIVTRLNMLGTMTPK